MGFDGMVVVVLGGEKTRRRRRDDDTYLGRRVTSASFRVRRLHSSVLGVFTRGTLVGVRDADGVCAHTCVRVRMRVHVRAVVVLPRAGGSLCFSTRLECLGFESLPAGGMRVLPALRRRAFCCRGDLR